MIRYPPPPELLHLHNPFAKLPAYQYSQKTFKSFSEEEIKGQAGKDNLPAATGSRTEEYEVDVAEASSEVRRQSKKLRTRTLTTRTERRR